MADNPGRDAPSTEVRREILGRAASGGIAGGLTFVAASDLGLVTALGVSRLLHLDEGWLFWIAIAAAAFVATTRARLLVPGIAGITIALYALAGFTPIFNGAIRGWALHEAPQRADAIVVLSSDVTDEGRITSNGVTRLLAGIELARAGYAPALVRTDVSPPRPDDTRDAAEIMAALPGIELVLTEPVASTRDEAREVARLARERGWRRVIVVTQPVHERRAAAVFRAAGLDVVATSAPERSYSFPTMSSTGDRLRGFRDWITELSAWTLYSARGWV